MSFPFFVYSHRIVWNYDSPKLSSTFFNFLNPLQNLGDFTKLGRPRRTAFVNMSIPGMFLFLQDFLGDVDERCRGRWPVMGAHFPTLFWRVPLLISSKKKSSKLFTKWTEILQDEILKQNIRSWEDRCIHISWCWVVFYLTHAPQIFMNSFTKVTFFFLNVLNYLNIILDPRMKTPFCMRIHICIHIPRTM